MKNWTDLVKEHLGITLSEKQLSQFQILQDELMEWNEKINLTAIKDIRGIQEKHFFDSLTCFRGLKGCLRA